MAYIVQRKDRFYVVAYDGLDPLTGQERRRWHPAGRDHHEAEQMATRIERDAAGSAPLRGGPVHLGEFLTHTWLALKRRHVRTSTAYRYSWMVDNTRNLCMGPAVRSSAVLGGSFGCRLVGSGQPWASSRAGASRSVRGSPCRSST